MLWDTRQVGVPLEELRWSRLGWWILLLEVIRVGVYEFPLRYVDVRLYFPLNDGMWADSFQVSGSSLLMVAFPSPGLPVAMP